MNRRILFLAVSLVLLGAGGVLAWQLALPVPVASADRATFTSANQLYANGNYEAAETLYRQLLANGIENADVAHNLAATLTALGQSDRAQEMTARARAIAPREPYAESQAGANGLPLTPNESALFALGLLYFSTVLFVLWRSQVVPKKVANV